MTENQRRQFNRFLRMYGEAFAGLQMVGSEPTVEAQRESLQYFSQRKTHATQKLYQLFESRCS